LAAWFLSQVGSSFSGVNLLGSSAWFGASVHKRTPSASKDFAFIVISLQWKETLGLMVAEIGIFKSTTLDILMVPLCWVGGDQREVSISAGGRNPGSAWLFMQASQKNGDLTLAGSACCESAWW
jgi:hypothetical protein